MKNKGFTLVELLGVIVVLSIILLTSIPSIIKTFKDANLRENTAYLTRLYAAAETYVELNRESFDQLDSDGGRVDVPIKRLMDEGLIKTLGVDPITGNTITLTDTVMATRQGDGSIEYALYFEDTNIDSYVSSGKIFHLDAIHNVGLGHSNTSLVWNDLTNYHSDTNLLNFNFDINSGWGNKGLKLDGVNDIAKTVTSGYDFSTLKSGQAFTIGALFTTNTVNSWMGLLSNMPAWGTGGFNIQYGTAQNVGLGMGTYLSNSVGALIGTTYSVYGVYSGTVMSLYINGVYVGQTTYSIPAGSKVMTLGCFYDTPSLLTDGTIRTVVAYNRALTLGEIQTNYNLDLIRYR